MSQPDENPYDQEWENYYDELTVEEMEYENNQIALFYAHMRSLEEEENNVMNKAAAKNKNQAPLTNTKGLTRNYLGTMTDKCTNCDAQFFKGELIPGKLNFCCQSGTIKLDSPFADFPDTLKREFKDPLRPNILVNKNQEVAFAKFDGAPFEWLAAEYPNLICKGKVQHIVVSPENYDANNCLPNNWIADTYNQMAKQGSVNVNPVDFLLNRNTSNGASDRKNVVLTNSNPFIDPMAYPLFFPNGAAGWHEDLKVSQSEYYRYLAMVRNDFNPLHHGSVLTRQFFMDSWARIDQNRLQSYQGSNLLPSSHAGSYRNLIEEYFDSMAVFSKYGSPDIAVIFTCNPNWKEMQEHLVSGQEAHDRPDLIARVFRLKVDLLIYHLIEEDLLGKVVAYVMCYEWQKRGLPHIHLALIMQDKRKEKVESVFTDQLPDMDDIELYETVRKRMRTKDDIIFTYNPDLLRIFDAHIHVKACSSYYPKLYKYMHKGSNPEANKDLGRVINDKDFNEIDHYLKNRSFCAPEACHRLFGFPVFQRSHPVHRLPIHLPVDQHEPTQLTEYFKMNREFEAKLARGEAVADPRKITYQNFPRKFSWDGEQWQEKEQPDEGVIGRLDPVTPGDEELFALRQLLIFVPGATSFQDLLKISMPDGSSEIKETLHKSAKARGLLTYEEITKGWKENQEPRL